MFELYGQRHRCHDGRFFGIDGRNFRDIDDFFCKRHFCNFRNFLFFGDVPGDKLCGRLYGIG